MTSYQTETEAVLVISMEVSIKRIIDLLVCLSGKSYKSPLFQNVLRFEEILTSDVTIGDWFDQKSCVIPWIDECRFDVGSFNLNCSVIVVKEFDLLHAR